MTKRAVILAGGRGTRLAPYTTVLPKPLMPVGDRAILDVVVRQLQSAGVERVTIAVGHLAHLIQAVFGDGSRHGLRIDYEEEETPQGTAGPLATIEDLDDTFLMLNGDVLTTLDYRTLIDAHERSGSLLTIATHERSVNIDYGVLHVDDGSRVVGFDEKPTLAYTVSMGVYVLEPAVRAFVPASRPFDLPDLVQSLLDAGERVGAFPYDGYWLDIGRRDDYERAVAEFDELLPQLPAAISDDGLKDRP
jgi:NDP-sugar pyrophosphorylase family protein